MAVKLAVWPTSRPMSDGWSVTTGATAPALTVTVAAVVATLAVTLFVNRARYWCPLAAVVNVAVV